MLKHVDRGWGARRALGVAIAALLVAGAACGSDDDSSDTAAPAAADTTGSADATESGDDASTDSAGSSASSDAADDRETDPDATLTWSYAVAGLNLDPDLSPSWTMEAYTRPVYDKLIIRNESGELEAGLATSWEFVDDTTLELQLQDGVVFQDGSTFDAEVVKANLERTIDIEGGTQKSLLERVDSVEVVDPMTVRINLTEPDATLPSALTTFPGMMISGEAIASGMDLSTEAVGSGPYAVVAHDPEVATEYERFADSWQPDQAAAAQLVIINNPDSGQRLNQLRTDQAQTTHIDTNLVSEAEADGFQVQTKASDNAWSIQLNWDRPALQTAQAREAINLALDREALIDGLDFGYGNLTNQVVPEGQAGHNADVVPVYDPERARELAEESGLSGQTLRFISSAIPVLQSFQEAVGAMLAEVGVEVEIVPVERAQMTAETAGGDWDLLMNFWPGAADPWLTYNAFLTPGGPFNPGAEVPAEVASLMSDARTVTDPGERTAVLESLAAAVDEEQLLVILSHPQRPTAARPEVVHFNGNVHSIPDLRGTGIAAG